MPTSLVRKNELTPDELGTARLLTMGEGQRHDLPMAQLLGQIAQGVADGAGVGSNLGPGPVRGIDLSSKSWHPMRQISQRS
ncbi:hypothetical protein NOK12_11910 [Nocardioides sp. OK12]|nr:hypothetical protein NOK12_11910 [Nocardioides sp. OK12]